MGIIETISSDLNALQKRVEALTTPSEPTEWARIATLAARYDISKNHVENLVHDMAAAGYPVEKMRIGRIIRYKSSQFDRGIQAITTITTLGQS